MLLLDDDRAVVRVAQKVAPRHALVVAGACRRRWWKVCTVRAFPNRQCFAKFDGHQVTTHAGWDGPVITRFHLPHHAKAGPGTAGCDEILPFNDGLRVLWRDATG